jgi:hypothetical protein
MAMQEDTFRKLFWDRLCRQYRIRRRNRQAMGNLPIDGITGHATMEDENQGHLGVDGPEQSEAERRLGDFADDGLVEILPNRRYRLTPQGEQFCADRPA